METLVDKLDLQKADPNYYKATRNPELRDLDTYYFLSVSGKSSPESTEFLNAIELLYAIAYAIKFTSKAEDNDFVVPKMEGYWWIDGGLDVQHNFANTPRDQWNWKIVIRMPDFIEEDHFNRACHKVQLKNPELTIDNVRFERINEGLAVQCLHLGSYEEEEPTIASMINFINENGLEIDGYHHEIYLSDPRRTPEHKLKTILRYGVRKK